MLAAGLSYNLVLYIHNTGQGPTELRVDGSVYINDTLARIIESPAGTTLDSGTAIPITAGETKEIVVDCEYIPGAEMRIKVVTADGISAQITTKPDDSLDVLEDYLTFQPDLAIEVQHSTSEPLRVQRFNGADQPITSGSITIELFVSPMGAFYSDASCTHEINQIIIPDGNSESEFFYFMENQPRSPGFPHSI